MKSVKTRIAVLAAVAAVGVTAAAAGPSAAQKYNVPKGAATIKMVLKGKVPSFKGAKSVKSGQKLTLVNASDPKAIGPHTFTLIEQDLLPHGKKELKACGKRFEGVCGELVAAHKANPKTGKVKKHLVKAGKKGWDTETAEGAPGDSWFTETLDEDFTQKVTAKAGTTLHYFCLVHPEMQGTIKVK